MTRILVASIRYWYPDIPIALIKDELLGNFDTIALEKYFNVSVFPMKTKKFGWGFSKFEAFFGEEKKRFLMLDADIIFVGPVLDSLEKFNEDFVVHNEPFTKESLYKYYFNLEKLCEYDPSFQFPGFTFNTGQIAGTSGILSRKDFEELIRWTEPRILLRRDVFTFGGEQPVVNYILMKKMTRNEISLKRFDFMREGLHPDTRSVRLENIISKKGYPFLIHWHDKKPNIFHPSMKEVPRNDLLLYFENIFYRNIPAGTIRKFMTIHFERIDDKMRMNWMPLVKSILLFKKPPKKISER